MDSKKRKVLQEENGDTDITPEDVRALIEPFSKEQLMDIIQNAAVDHSDVLEEIRVLADKDPAHRKLFVRGLGWDTAAEAVKGVFSQFGEIEDCSVIMDKSTGKSKGYGFVTFKHMDGAQRALKDPSKKIEGRVSVCQLASAGPVASSQTFSQSLAPRKIYVGNVPHDITADKLLAVFSQFGEIEEGPLGFDKQTGKCKGYALFIYKTEDSAKRALEDPIKTVAGHQVNCKLADGQKKISSQAEGVDLLAQAGIVGPSPTFPYNPSALSGLLGQGILGQHSTLAAQGLLSGLNPNSGLTGLSSLHPSLAQQLALSSSLGSSLNSSLSSLNSSLPTSLNTSLSQGLSQTYGQTPSSVGLGSYGGLHGLGGYGSQVGGLGGAGSSLYSGSLQGSGGHHSLSALQSSPLGQPSGSRAQSLSSYFST